MIYAKINPTAKTVKQLTPFTTELLESDYMTVIAVNYGAGAKEIKFTVIFGVMSQLNEFYKKDSTEITMTAEEIFDWGQDDTVLLSIIATKIGTTVIEYITTELGDLLI